MSRLKIGEAAEFRMYARQIKIFGSANQPEEVAELLDLIQEDYGIDDKYIALFKMCCNLEFVEALGSAGVSHCHDRDK